MSGVAWAALTLGSAVTVPDAVLSLAKAWAAKLNAAPTRVDPLDGRAYTLASFRL